MGIRDSVANVFGLGSVWRTIETMPEPTQDQFFLILEELMFAGTAAFNQAKPIFSQLEADLMSHPENATPLVANALHALVQILNR